jgi:uncharacterized protein with GYD domain
MAIWVSLVNLTDQGIKNIKQGPERLEEAANRIEEVGGKLLGFYLTMGDYDYVTIVEGPSDEVAMTFLMGLGAAGNIRTKTLKAFTLDEFKAMVKGLP